MKIVAFTGKKRVGKTTACKIMEVLYPGRVAKLNFKAPLLQELKEYFPDVLDYYIEGPDFLDRDDVLEKKPGCIRQLMQNFGTDLRRDEDPEYWTKLWEEDILEADLGGDIIVVDDVRFLNEAQMVKKHGGIIIELTGDTAEEGDSHTSEMEMKDIVPDHHFIVYKGEMVDMIGNIHSIVKDYID